MSTKAINEMASTLNEKRVPRMTSIQIHQSHHHFIVLSILNNWIINTALPNAKGVMLDYGCGGQPYRSLFETKITQYIGADVVAEKGISLDLVIPPGGPLPLENNSVDTVLSTQTLEHVYDFQYYIAECYRVLRPEGQLILTVPMQWRMHEQPHDYWRFTKNGVGKLLLDSGFSSYSITACGGAWALAGQIINSHLNETGRGSPFIYRIVNRIALWADRRMKDPDETICWMCIARRPQDEPHSTLYQ